MLAAYNSAEHEYGSMEKDTPVVIAGAGPVGCLLALYLAGATFP